MASRPSTDDLIERLQEMGLNQEDCLTLKAEDISPQSVLLLTEGDCNDMGLGPDGQEIILKLADGETGEIWPEFKLMVPHCVGPPELPGDETDNGCIGTLGAAAYVSTQKLWRGREAIKVHFLNTPVLESWTSGRGRKKVSMTTSMVLEWANVWSQCSAVPQFVEICSAKRADVRVMFSDSCWSMVGMDAHKVKDLTKPTLTLNLKGYPEDFQKHLVIHEFGHALGLEHEHQRSDFWDVVEKHLDVEAMGRDPRTADYSSVKARAAFGKDWFKKKDKGTLSDYDADSIMHYWFDVHWLKDPRLRLRRTLERDTNLSDKEKKYLRGIHTRNNDYAKNPSPTDLKYLAEAYLKK